jgi:Fe-S-cluster containining protein
MNFDPQPAEEEDVTYVCQRCANCCRWPGEVPVSEREIDAISTHLGLPAPVFIEQYTKLRLNRTGLTLIEKPDGACIFLENNDCSINPVKPDQCRGFPNQWNFSGWRDVCEAIPVPKAQLKIPDA